jgi:23S rRNA pseudouridine1911/1915/1917 synthase
VTLGQARRELFRRSFSFHDATNVPSFVVSQRESQRSLAAVLQSRLRLSRTGALRLLRDHRVLLGAVVCRNPTAQVRRGQRVTVKGLTSHARSRSGGEGKGRGHNDRRKASAGPRLTVRFMDADVIVVDKPPGLTTMRHPNEAAEFGARAQRFLPATLADELRNHMAANRQEQNPSIRAVHRVDRDTSGLVVFARTPLAQGDLAEQFRAHTVERRYVALVRGRAKSQRIESNLAEDRGDGRRGSTKEPGAGKRAVTHVRTIEDLGDHTLVECRLETGRTHQVRIHLGEAGTPICGERVYDRPLHGRPVPDGSGMARTALHAATLGFKHPRTGERMQWTSAIPEDMAAAIKRIRRTGPAAEQKPESGRPTKG